MYWEKLEWTGTPLMDTFDRPHGSENTIDSAVIGAGEIRNNAMIYSANELSRVNISMNR